MSSAATQSNNTTSNPLGIRSIDHLEFFVDDVDKWVDYHERKLGLYKRAKGDESTGVKGRRAFVVGQGRVNFLFAEAQGDSKEAATIREFVELHGCGVKDIAFRVDDVAHALAEAEKRGAKIVRPLDKKDGFTAGTIQAYGDVTHTFIHRESTRTFAPNYVDATGGVAVGEISLDDDRPQLLPTLKEWISGLTFMLEFLGLMKLPTFDIKTGKSSLMSKVVGDEDGYIRLPINEPSFF